MNQMMCYETWNMLGGVILIFVMGIAIGVMRPNAWRKP